MLKADHNPIEWPPKDVMEWDEDLEDPDAMNRWVDQLKDWMAENPLDEDDTMSQVSYSNASQTEDESKIDAGVTPTPHVRTFSIDSETSIYTASSYTNSIEGSMPEMPPTIDTVNVSPTLPTGFSESPDSYLPTPDDSVDDDTTRPIVSPQHGRNRSYAVERQTRLAMQKSLPDLRRTKTNFVPHERVVIPAPTAPTTSKQPSYESLSSQAGPSSASPSDIAPLRVRPRPSRQGHEPTASTSERKAPSMDFERNSYFRRLSTLPTSKISRTINPALLSVIDSVRGILFAVSQIYQSLQHYTVYAIDERLSSVLLKVLDPASSNMMDLISALDKFDMLSRTGCPPPHVCRRVVECCRDIVAMFGKAVGVLALQLKVLASRDDVRYSRHMLLMLYGAMAEISNAWSDIAPQLETIEPLLHSERTFGLPSKTSPSPSPGAASMSMNGKPMGYMPPSYKTHYASQASSGRIHIPPIAEQPEPSSSSAPSTSNTSLPLQAPTLFRTRSAQHPLLINRSITTPTVVGAPSMKRPSVSEGRLRTSRRHAGSFSVKDVEIGASLPSNSEPSPPPGGVASGSSTPTPRSTSTLPRTAPHPGFIPPLPSSTTSIHPPFPLPSAHSRQSSAQNGLISVPLMGPSRNNHDTPTASNTLVDKEAIDAMAGAVRTAPYVWSMLEEISDEMQDAPVDLRDSLAKAKAVTQRLGENIKAIQDCLPNADRKALREDAHVFVKVCGIDLTYCVTFQSLWFLTNHLPLFLNYQTVIALSKVVKNYGAAHQLSSQLRSDIAKLTNATQEFVMLLHVSSFSPSSTPRPYSPMPNGIGGGSSAVPNGQVGLLSSLIAEEKQHVGGANLSRSRSAQPSASSKLAVISATAAPRSALPHQSFKIPVLPSRTNTSSRARIADAGDIS